MPPKKRANTGAARASRAPRSRARPGAVARSPTRAPSPEPAEVVAVCESEPEVIWLGPPAAGAGAPTHVALLLLSCFPPGRCGSCPVPDLFVSGVLHVHVHVPPVPLCMRVCVLYLLSLAAPLACRCNRRAGSVGVSTRSATPALPSGPQRQPCPLSPACHAWRAGTPDAACQQLSSLPACLSATATAAAHMVPCHTPGQHLPGVQG